MDLEEQIINVFWDDTRMLIDYSLLGDLVSLDTTFGTNKKNMPLDMFCEFNHYRGIVIFGMTLLYDQTAESLN